jgi:hypothetical protein
VEAKLETLNKSHNEKVYAIEKNYILAEKEIRYQLISITGEVNYAFSP